MYSSGLSSMTAFAVARPLPDTGALWVTAGVLLNTAGALFALYVLATMTLLAGSAVRRRRGGARELP